MSVFNEGCWQSSGRRQGHSTNWLRGRHRAREIFVVVVIQPNIYGEGLSHPMVTQLTFPSYFVPQLLQHVTHMAHIQRAHHWHDVLFLFLYTLVWPDD